MALIGRGERLSPRPSPNRSKAEERAGDDAVELSPDKMSLKVGRVEPPVGDISDDVSLGKTGSSTRTVSWIGTNARALRWLISVARWFLEPIDKFSDGSSSGYPVIYPKATVPLTRQQTGHQPP